MEPGKNEHDIRKGRDIDAKREAVLVQPSQALGSTHAKQARNAIFSQQLWAGNTSPSTGSQFSVNSSLRASRKRPQALKIVSPATDRLYPDVFIWRQGTIASRPGTCLPSLARSGYSTPVARRYSGFRVLLRFSLQITVGQTY